MSSTWTTEAGRSCIHCIDGEPWASWEATSYTRRTLGALRQGRDRRHAGAQQDRGSGAGESRRLADVVGVSAEPPIVAFYRGTGRDAAGRTIEQVWAMDLEQLEVVHDYIQWLFPTRKASAFNPEAPLLSDAVIAALASVPDFRQRMLRSLDVMLRFYELRRVGEGASVSIEPGRDLGRRGPLWWRAGNHNHLRLTRIISSLREFGLREEAVALYRCLAEIRRDWPTGISDRTVAYWAEATSG